MYFTCPLLLTGNVWHHPGWKPAGGRLWASRRVSRGILESDPHLDGDAPEPPAGTQPGPHHTHALPHQHLWTAGTHPPVPKLFSLTLMGVVQIIKVHSCYLKRVIPSEFVAFVFWNKLLCLVTTVGVVAFFSVGNNSLSIKSTPECWHCSILHNPAVLLSA